MKMVGVRVVQGGERRINITLTENDSKSECFDEILSDEDYEYEKMIWAVGSEDEDISNAFR